MTYRNKAPILIAKISASILINIIFVSGCNLVNSSELISSKNIAVNAMHPSWDMDQDGINDCENDGSCDHTTDYSLPRNKMQPKTSATKPTFDCSSDDLSSAEKLICSDGELAAYDQSMADVFTKALNSIEDEGEQKTFKAIQRGWIKGRNECWKADDLKNCIIKSYRQRQSEIEARYRLVPASIPVQYVCEDDPHNTFIVTYFASLAPTAVMERGDKSQLLYRYDSGVVNNVEKQQEAPTGVFYTGGDYIIKEYNGVATIQWGYKAETLNCQVGKNNQSTN